jgi:hypothetical protein
MKADTSNGPMAFTQTMVYFRSLSVLANFGMVMIMLSAAPVQTLAAKPFEFWDGLDLDKSKRAVILRHKKIMVSIPAGQTEITKLIPFPTLDKVDVVELTNKINTYDPQWGIELYELNAIPALQYLSNLKFVDEGERGQRMEVLIRVMVTDSVYPDYLLSSPWRMLVATGMGAGGDLQDVSKGTKAGDLYPLFKNSYSNYIIAPDEWSLRLYHPQYDPAEISGGVIKENLPLPATPLLSITLRLIPTVCWMQVEYSGDVQGADSGDLAYYNNFMKAGSAFEGGVGRATGSGSDTGALEALGAVVDWNKAAEEDVLSAAEASAMAGSNFNPIKNATSGGGSDSSDQKMKEAVKKKKADDKANLNKDEFYAWLRGEPDERETFGLSMAGRNSERTGSQAASAVGAVDVDQIRGVGQLVTSSVLLAASRSKLKELTVDPSLNIAWYGPIPLSRLEFRPVAMGALFSWSEGKPGFGKLQVKTLAGGMLKGEITGTLYSREMRRPDGSSSVIDITAKFLAAEGAFSCDLPGVGAVK